MKTIFLLLFCCAIILVTNVQAQNWSTFGGDGSRSGKSKISGPADIATPYWAVSNAANTLLGEQVYSFGDIFVNSRVGAGFNTVKIECRNLQTGALIWTSPFIASNSKLYCIGISEDAVYGCDYATDSVYALHNTDGTIKWTGSLTSLSYGARESVVFACNGDIILNGPGFGGPTTMRLNKDNGQLVWGNNELYAVSPVGALAAWNQTVYRIIGAINQPIQLAAIDMESGTTLRLSDPLPGDGDQENQVFLSDAGNILFWRDNGFLYSFSDDGNQIKENWHYVSQSPPTGSNNSRIAFGQDGHIYAFDAGKILHLNSTDGSLLNETNIGSAAGSITIGADSTVYYSNENNAVFALSADLQQQLWTLPFSNNAFGNTPLSKDGVMVLTGAGSGIKAFRPDQNRKPVADFRVSARKISIGQSVSFYDQSSYAPQGWEWHFEGAGIPDASEQNPTGIIYPVVGSYSVSLKAINSFGNDSLVKNCYIEVVDEGVGLNNHASSQMTSLSPNPANTFTKLQFYTPTEGNCYAKIFDINGRLTMELEIPCSSAGICTTSINTTGLHEGIWMLQLQRAEGPETNIRLMVQH